MKTAIDIRICSELKPAVGVVAATLRAVSAVGVTLVEGSAS
jgi:hypothetical protein